MSQACDGRYHPIVSLTFLLALARTMFRDNALQSLLRTPVERAHQLLIGSGGQTSGDQFSRSALFPVSYIPLAGPWRTVAHQAAKFLLFTCHTGSDGMRRLLVRH